VERVTAFRHGAHLLEAETNGLSQHTETPARSRRPRVLHARTHVTSDLRRGGSVEHQVVGRVAGQSAREDKTAREDTKGEE